MFVRILYIYIYINIEGYTVTPVNSRARSAKTYFVCSSKITYVNATEI